MRKGKLDSNTQQMTLTLENFQQIRSGAQSPFWVGNLSHELIQKLGWVTPCVYFSKETLAHINEKHPDISDFDMLHIPLALKNGLVLKENSADNRVIIAYQPELQESRFRLVLKSTMRNTEIWISSFHRMKRRQTKSMLSRTTILQTHK
jgi:hypothetical protein